MIITERPTQTLLGLSSQEAHARRVAGHNNSAAPPTGRTYRQILIENVWTFVNGVFAVLGLALLLLDRPLDALVSTGIVVLNVLVSLVQELRAKRTLDRVALLNRPSVTVRRDGREQDVPPEEVVVGDLLLLRSGDQVIVDGWVVGDGRVQVDESQLTGESEPVAKQTGDPVYSGSFCTSGSAAYIAEKVGTASRAYKMTAAARAHRRVLTPLQRDVNLVFRIIVLVVGYLEFLVVARALLTELSLPESVQQATVVAGVIPNGLLLALTVAYALGALRLARTGVLVQQVNAVESLSHVDVLCLDKTGTLTTNQLQVSAVHPRTIDDSALQEVLGKVTAAMGAQTTTSAAIAAAYPAAPAPVLAEVPFSSARKWSAIVVGAPEAGANGTTPPAPSLRPGIYALGAPEMLLPVLRTLSDGHAIETQVRELAAEGLRVLLIAHHPDSTTLVDQDDATQLPAGMTALGLVSLRDVLRPEAATALATLHEAGVAPKIISGDNPDTVAALARQVGLVADNLVSGIDLACMDDAAFAAAARDGTIFGRITPEQKARLVGALRQQGRYVAMIGDGVNDVLALKAANLGVAMQSGSAATRGVADIVLLNDSFAALGPAVAEGQRIQRGMADVLKLFLTRVGVVGLLLLSSLVIGEFPIALRQSSLVSLLSVGVPSVLLAAWARPGPLSRHDTRGAIFHFALAPILATSVVGLLLFYGTLIARLIQQLGGDIAAVTPELIAPVYEAVRPVAQTTLSVFLIGCGLLLLVAVEPPTAWWTGGDRLSGDQRPTRLAGALGIVFLLILTLPPLRALFALSPIGGLELGAVALALASWLLLVRWLWRQRVVARLLGHPALSVPE